MLRKINKGVLLTILVLAILITYIVIVEVQRNSEKNLIKEVCEKYIDFENKYTVIPKEYRESNGKIISKEKIEDYKKEAADELKKLMINDENIYNQQKNIIEDKLEEQEWSYEINLKKYSKSIKIKKYEFDGDQVVATIENIVEIETVGLYSDEININDENFSTNKENNKYEDTITLKRENGTWKIVFADIETTLGENGFFF